MLNIDFSKSSPVGKQKEEVLLLSYGAAKRILQHVSTLRKESAPYLFHVLKSTASSYIPLLSKYLGYKKGL